MTNSYRGNLFLAFRDHGYKFTVFIISLMCCTDPGVRLILTALCPSAQALSTDSVERLPVFNMSALRHYKLSLEADDWCVPSKEPLNLANYRAEK